MFRRRQKQPVSGRRRPEPADSPRRNNFAYYTQSRSTRGDGEHISRRQPLPRDKGEILRYLTQRFGVILAVVAAFALLVSSLQVAMTPKIKVLNDTAVYRVHSNDVYQEGVTQALRSSWTNTNKL